MGMTMELWRLTPSELASLEGDEGAWHDFVGRAGRGTGPWDRPRCELDKSWAIIHFLLTGTWMGGEHPANLLVFGPALYEQQDEYEFVPLVLVPENVRDFAAHLASVDDETLRGRFDLEKMAATGIYPILDPAAEDRTQLMEYTFHHLGNLRTFMLAAAEAGDAAIVDLG